MLVLMLHVMLHAYHLNMHVYAGAEVGGLCQLGGKTWMTFDAGHLFEAPAATGPFTAVSKNYNFFTQEGHSAFARLWGELYTGDKDLALLSHQQIAGPAIYAGLIKEVVLGKDDGVLRAQWWSNNDVLKAGPLTPSTTTTVRAVADDSSGSSGSSSSGGGFSKSTTECVGACVSSGMWLEGTIKAGDAPAGIWVELNGTALNKTSGGYGFGFMIDSSGNFSLGELDLALQGGRRRQTAVDIMRMMANPPLVIDRAMADQTKAGTELSFKLLIRNAWSNLGMSEFYVNDVLALPFTLPVALTGSYAPTASDGSVKISGVYRLSLPEASSRSSSRSVWS